MLGWETAALGAGRAVAQRAAAAWLSDRRNVAERSKSLSELVELRVRDRFRRRTLDRQVEEMADGVARRLEPLCLHEFRGLDNGDRTAALTAVADAFAAADLSDDALFATDLDSGSLKGRMRAALPGRGDGLGLGEPGARFLDLVLAECCECYVRIVTQLDAFGPRASVEVLERLSRLGEQVALVLERLPARRLDPDGDGDDHAFERRYLQLVSDRLDRLELFGIDVHRYRPRTTLSVAYVSLTVSAAEGGPEAGRRRRPSTTVGSRAGRAHDEAAAENAVRVEAALAGGSRTLVRGEAGSGKTTLLAWLAVIAARGRFTGPLRDWNGCVPFLIRLRRYADADLPQPGRFMDEAAGPIAGLAPAGWAHRVLEAGRALVLVDGVDEVPATARRDVREWLGALAAAYPSARFIVSSRPSAAAADWLAVDGFRAVLIEPLGPADVRALVRHWHDAVRDAGNLPCDPGDLPGYEASLLARLDAAAHLQALATTPLLAAMLCALNLDRRTHLPRDRMSLYAAAVAMLIERRDVERGISSDADRALPAQDKVSLLQDLAWRLSFNNRSELSIEQAATYLGRKLRTMGASMSADAEGYLGYLILRSGLIRSPVPGRVVFVHRTIQEYLTAKEIAEEDHIGALLDMAHLDQWQQVVIMTAGHANTPLRVGLVTGLLDRVDQERRHARTLTLLAAACVETAPTLPSDLRHRVDARLNALLPPNGIVQARSLAAAGDPVLRRLPTNLSSLSAAAAAATIRTAALINGPDALTLLAGYAADPRPRVQRELTHVWQYFDPDSYARRVLADAPLDRGRLLVRSAALLPAVHHLCHLDELHVLLDGVADLGVLANVPALTRLDIEGVDEVDLGALGDQPRLRHLAVGEGEGVQRVRGTSKLRRMPALESLWLPVHDPLPDLQFITAMPELVDLWVGDVKDAGSRELLVESPKLRLLSFYRNRDPLDPDLIRSLPQLTYVATRFPGRDEDLRELSAALHELPHLEDVGLWDCASVTDLRPLAGLPLRRLRLTGALALSDLRPVADLSRLTKLFLTHSPVTDIGPLSNLQHLTELFLVNATALRDLSPLVEVRSLRWVVLYDATYRLDLTPLADTGRVMDIFISKDQPVHVDPATPRRVRLRRF